MEARMLVILLSSSILIHFALAERQFFYVHDTLDWTKAQAYCRENYIDLVTVCDEQENQKLMALAEERVQCVWLGLRHNSDNWRWSKGGPASRVNAADSVWANGQPNNSDGNQNCAMISHARGSGLQDKACTDQYYFICFEGEPTANYTLVKQSKTWQNAREYCKTNHVDLASIHSEEDTTRFLDMLTQQGVSQAWIGLRRQPWNSWSDNNSTTFENWETKPDTYASNDQCGCLWEETGKWKVYPCSNSNRFFCYGAIAEVDPTPNLRQQTVVKVKFESGMDLYSREIQHQILEQMKSGLGSVGEANFTVKWRATRKMINP